MRKFGLIVLTALFASGFLGAAGPREPKDVWLFQMAQIAEMNKRFNGGAEGRFDVDFHDRGFGYLPITHFIRERDLLGSYITIEDGSMWSISYEDQWIARNWYGSTELAIQPNSLSQWLYTNPLYRYRLVNTYTGESVQANLAAGPLVYDPNTHHIVSIDYYRGDIFLDNGEIWRVDFTGPCREMLSHWYPGNAVIGGTNDTWFSLSSPYILICVEDNNWLPAIRIN